MENLRFKRHSNRQGYGSIDGFANRRRPALRNVGSSDTSPPVRRRAQINDFDRSEGFHPGTRQQMSMDASGGAVLEQPIPKKSTRRSWRNKRKKQKKEKGPIRIGRLHISAKARKIIARSLIAVVVLVVLTGAFLFVKGWWKARQILKGGSSGAIALQENVDPSLLNGEGDGRVNILLLGKGGEGHEAPDLTDTIVLVSVDPIQKEASLLSIPRDFYVKVPEYGNMKINAAYASAKNDVLGSARVTDELRERAEKAGLESIEKTIENTLGVPVHYYAMVDFKGFEQAIDTVGGIDLNVEKPLYEVMRINGRKYILNVKAGNEHFDGFRALAYARSRMTSPRGDFDRAQRQRAIMLALKDKILSVGTFANPLKINQLIDAFGDHAQTNLSTGELMRLYELSKEINGDKVSSIGLADPPNNYVTTGRVGNQSVVIPRAGVGNFSEIQSFVRNTLKDGYLRNENATIAVYNSTSKNGLAATKAEELRSFGYNISTVANAPTRNLPQTIIVDLRNGEKKYTKRYLEQRFGVSVVTSMPTGSGIDPGNADFVIILGQNETTSN